MTAAPVERVNGTPLPVEPRFEYDPVAHAEAEAIRTRAEADAEARRIAADAEAKAKLATAAEEARKLKLANDKAEARALEEQAARQARIAESDRKRREAERAQAEADREARRAEQVQAEAAAEVAVADDRWQSYALNFYRVCAVVALPVQVSAFYNPKAIWLMAAPLMLEGGAWVVLKGAAAAVANRRPSWHYRLIAWLLAFVAAGINLWHGLNAFDPATALATAFASIAGPGVWDLHEHGRIRKRDGVPTRRERRAAKKEAKRLAAEQAEKELRDAERQAYREKAARDAAEELDRTRREEFPDVHRHARKLAADLGETSITPAIWKQAKLDVDGALPGESADVIRMRNASEARVEAARQKRPVSTVSKTTNAQRAAQMPPGPNRVLKTRATRRPGDTPKYATAARKAAAITAKQATEKKD